MNVITYKDVKIGEPFKATSPSMVFHIPAGLSLRLLMSADGDYYDVVPDELRVVGDLKSGAQQVFILQNIPEQIFLKFDGTGDGVIKIKR